MRAALARLIGASFDSPDFDSGFYRAHYVDLHVLKTKAALRRHYREHGKAEGRFPSLAAARAHFEAVHGPAPEDFDVGLYRQLNPDLAKLYTDPIQYEMHFLEYGRFEERPYSAASGKREDAWQRLLNVYDFNLLNESWLPRGGVDRAAALVAMQARGIARLAPVARAWMFDPAFYRAHYGIEGDDVALYRDWLHQGFPEGRAPNEVRALAGLLAGKPYPEAFDWRKYCRIAKIDAAAPFPAKIRALEVVFEQPLDARARGCVGGRGAGRLYEDVGNYNLIRARYRETADAFGCAIEAGGGQISRLHLRLGDALKAMGEPLPALASYRRALSLPDCSIWALIHACTILLARGLHREAAELAEAQSARFRAHELFDGFVDEIAEVSFRAVSDTMSALIRDGEPDAVIDTLADARLGEITAFIRKMKIGAATRLPATRPRRVVMLACLDLAQCTFYRVEQKRRLLRDRGIALEVYDCNDPPSFVSALPGAAAAIFYRVPGYPKIVEAILVAEALGIETFFDIDDLVFTRDFPDSFESYEKQITRQEYAGLRHGVALYRQAISLCEGAIVSTRPLAGAIAPLVKGGAARTFVVPNGLDDRSERAARFVRSNGTPGDSLSIFYGSGTKAHGRDFSDIVAPALVEALAGDPRVRLVVTGWVRLDERFDPHEAQITRLPFIEDLDTYWAILASCDISISVLRPGPIADGKSEIKWLEAAMLAIPSIVSATAAYEMALHDGETVLLARDGEDWRRHLRALIDDAALRRRIGAAARELALREYGPATVTAKLEAALADRGPAPRADAPAKPRILVCNVFFAPQSYGGATRVVEDNVDQLLARYGDAFEISILSTFKGLAVGALRVDSYRGCPVYRIGTPLEVNMFWRPFNDDVLAAYRRVLEVARPDLVHFHCIQRLTASLVEETLRAGVPYVVTLHDAWWISDHQFLVDQDDRLVDVDEPFRTLLPAGVTRPQSLQRLQRLRSLLASAAATLAVSASFADLYRRAGVRDVEVCENGLSTLEARLARTTPPDRIVLGHIGGRSVHKGAGLIEAVLKLHAFRNLDLVMVDGTLDIGEEHVELWGSTPVTLRAPVERGDVDKLYAGIDVLLAPSIWPESYGLVVREALHFGAWVVAGDRGALAQDVVEGENGFVVDPSRTEGLAAVLASIDADVARFKTPPRATPLRRSSQQADDIVAVYRRVLRGTSARPPEESGAATLADIARLQDRSPRSRAG